MGLNSHDSSAYSLCACPKRLCLLLLLVVTIMYMSAVAAAADDAAAAAAAAAAVLRRTLVPTQHLIHKLQTTHANTDSTKHFLSPLTVSLLSMWQQHIVCNSCQPPAEDWHPLAILALMPQHRTHQHLLYDGSMPHGRSKADVWRLDLK
jgi:hypothetical protein